MNPKLQKLATDTLCILIVVSAGCSDTPSNSVVTRSIFPNDPNPATEYLLPCIEMPDDVRQSLHPWIQQMVGNSPGDVVSTLNQRWANIQTDSLRSLRTRLLEFHPHSILVHQEKAFLRMVRSDLGDTIYVPPPLDEPKVNEVISAFDAGENKEFREFIQHFAGVREEPPGHAGYFISDKLFRFTDFYGKSIDGYEEWKTSMILFHATNGDHVLMRSDGAVAWCVLPEQKTKPLANNFAEFVKHYVEYKRIAQPFDSYGPGRE